MSINCQAYDETDEVELVSEYGQVYYKQVSCTAAADWHGVSADGEMFICEQHRIEGDPNPLSSDPFWWVALGDKQALAAAREANAEYLTPDQWLDEVSS